MICLMNEGPNGPSFYYRGTVRVHEYIIAVKTLVQSIRASSMHCDVVIRPIMPRGIEGTLIRHGNVSTTTGYLLEIDFESFLFDQNGPYDCAYRYRFHKDGVQFMRIQTDKNGYPANARFPAQPDLHFAESHWDPKYQRPDFLKMYALFREIVSAKGELPEPFRAAAMGQIT